MFLKSQSRRAKDDAFRSEQCHAHCTTSRKPAHFVQNAQSMNRHRPGGGGGSESKQTCSGAWSEQ
jgi:hypothetical protein